MPIPPRWAAWSWRYGRRVRWAAAVGLLLLALAAATGTEAEPARVPVTVAARDVASGVMLTADDLTVVHWGVALDSPSPDQAAGAITRGPVAAGEPITRSRLVPGGAVTTPEGTLVVPLTLADDRVAALLNSGDRVDVLVTPDSLHEGEPRTVASDVEVLGVPAAEAGAFAGPQSGAVVLLAVPEDRAGDLAGIRRSDHVTVAIR